MVQLILSSLLFALNVHAAEPLTCVDGQARVLEFGKTREFALSYCYDSTRTVLTSKECAQGDGNRKCTPFVHHAPIAFNELNGQYGSPTFTLCRKLGGSAHVIEFKADKTWYKLDRCVFPNESFVDSGTLFKFHMYK